MGTVRVTSQQVAELAGVSQSAVSRVFTPGASVSAKTAQKVREAAVALGYQPNMMARAMITGKSRIIGLVVAYLDNHFYPAAVEQLSVALQARGYHVLVFMAAPTVGDVDHVMREIVAYQVEGIVLASVSMSSALAGECDAHGIPVVLFNRDQGDARLASVTTDNATGGRVIAAHLVALGRERIAYVAGFEGASTQMAREQGFRDGLAAARRDLFARGVGNFTYDGARTAARAMFGCSDRPDAVFVCNDHMAFAVMDALRCDLRLRVPEDVAVAGFDDVSVAAWPAFDLTSFRQPLDLMVAETVTSLMARIADRSALPRRVELQGELVIRGSTGGCHEGV